MIRKRPKTNFAYSMRLKGSGGVHSRRLQYVKPAVLEVIDKSQYGTIPHSSTIMVLINVLHHWYLRTVRTILFDYRKAFDFIDHEILINKVCRLNIPRGIINWIDFLRPRIQRVKLPEDCYSEWGSVPSGAPQGTKLGPWLFILMIQDVNINSPYLWKFVDDTTASEFYPKEVPVNPKT